ncbi:TonB family protein [Rhodanobacter sp. TND4EL1]
MDSTVLQSLLLSTLAFCVVLLVRRPVRRCLGAGPAFTLWVLPLLLTALPWLPALPAQLPTLPTMHVLPGTVGVVAFHTSHAALGAWLRLAWWVGVMLGTARLLLHYLNLHRHARPLPAEWQSILQHEMGELEPRRVRLHPAGPAVLCALRGLVLLPPDFLQRFAAAERQLILRHERAHLRRGDVLWSLLAEAIAVLLWFHPLTWVALPRFRLDQELACDERVLRDSPQDEAGYAHILMHSVGTPPVPALIPWLAEPQLKERLTMIQRLRPGALRRRIGYLGLAMLMAGSALVAQAGTNPASDHSAESDITYNSQLQPSYPAAAVKNRQEGTVILLVQVHADGTLGSIAYEPRHSTTTSADLIAAASTAARQWRFNPQMKDGKPIEGYARVPVKFSLTPLPDQIEKGQAEKLSSKH